MVEAAVGRHLPLQLVLAGVAERRMAEVVRQRDRLGQILVQPQRPRQRPRDLRHLQRMGQPGAVVVALVRDEDLGLLLQPPEGGGMDDPVAVALEGASGAPIPLPGSAARGSSRGGEAAIAEAGTAMPCTIGLSLRRAPLSAGARAPTFPLSTHCEPGSGDASSPFRRASPTAPSPACRDRRRAPCGSPSKAAAARAFSTRSARRPCRRRPGAGEGRRAGAHRPGVAALPRRRRDRLRRRTHRRPLRDQQPQRHLVLRLRHLASRSEPPAPTPAPPLGVGTVGQRCCSRSRGKLRRSQNFGLCWPAESAYGRRAHSAGSMPPAPAWGTDARLRTADLTLKSGPVLRSCDKGADVTRYPLLMGIIGPVAPKTEKDHASQ